MEKATKGCERSIWFRLALSPRGPPLHMVTVRSMTRKFGMYCIGVVREADELCASMWLALCFFWSPHRTSRCLHASARTALHHHHQPAAPLSGLRLSAALVRRIDCVRCPCRVATGAVASARFEGERVSFFYDLYVEWVAGKNTVERIYNKSARRAWLRGRRDLVSRFRSCESRYV